MISMTKEIPFEDQPSTKGDLVNFGEHIGNLILDSEKHTKEELRAEINGTVGNAKEELRGDIQGLRGDMEQGNSRLEEKIDKLTDAVQENTYHIKLLVPIIKVVAELKEKVFAKK